MSNLLFLKENITENRQTWAILPSSNFLAKKMVKKSDIENSEVIIEFWAWSWAFTEYIFQYSEDFINKKKIFIIEKDEDFYNLLIKKFPDYKQFIYNIDVLDIEKLFKENNIKKIDLIISWLPFKSLHKNIFDYLVTDLFPKFFKKNTKFIHFSYFNNFSKTLEKTFHKVWCEKCLLNIPSAYVFDCVNLKDNK